MANITSSYNCKGLEDRHYIIGRSPHGGDIFRNAVGLEISRFPSKERLCMPGSKTTQGRPDTRKNAPVRIAFHHANGVGTLN
ncbi:hypothetical protein [Acidisarcina polymorpha]|uniref:hypothetical protein n=1 Tax=Acidisarcina polymorpha TaxID=2211140 RepID=UPI001374A62D|nr:hypothetical protein [Acidisarcina polymorpha]